LIERKHIYYNYSFWSKLQTWKTVKLCLISGQPLGVYENMVS